MTKLGINNRAVFRKSDLFNKVRAEEKFDLIISNPPYIPFGTELSPEVQHEPSLALFAEENGICIYRKIIEQAPNFLNKKGYIMFEIGIGEAESIVKLLTKDFTNISVKKDLAGIDRVVIAQLKK